MKNTFMLILLAALAMVFSGCSKPPTNTYTDTITGLSMQEPDARERVEGYALICM